MATRTKFKSVKEYAISLIMETDCSDEDGRFVGYTYAEILRRVKRKFPRITYAGPHKDKPIKMTVKQLREIAYALQSSKRNLRLPVRPRSDRKRTRLSVATSKAKRGRQLSVATPRARKVASKTATTD